MYCTDYSDLNKYSSTVLIAANMTKSAKGHNTVPLSYTGLSGASSIGNYKIRRGQGQIPDLTVSRKRGLVGHLQKNKISRSHTLATTHP